MPLYDIEGDLTFIQNVLKADATVLSLLDLAGQSLIKKANDYITEKKTGNPSFTMSIEAACSLIIAKSIIKRSQWNDLVSSDKRLAIYPLPARSTRSEILFEQMFEIACHVPASEDFKARQVIGRTITIMNNTRIKGRYLRLRGLPGELPTMPGFYCFGCRFGYYDPI